MQPDKGNWSVIECSFRNTFLEKSYKKIGREGSPRPFLENQY